jgi:hypothetical protein
LAQVVHNVLMIATLFGVWLGDFWDGMTAYALDVRKTWMYGRFFPPKTSLSTNKDMTRYASPQGDPNLKETMK